MSTPNWKYVRGYVNDKRYHRVYRDDQLGVQLEVVTKRKNGMPAGKGKSRFYIDGNEYEFKTEEQMMSVWKVREENRLRNTPPANRLAKLCEPHKPESDRGAE